MFAIERQLISENYNDIICHVTLSVMLNFLFPDGFIILQQDNCPVHTARGSPKAIGDLRIVQLSWPTKLPYLNIVKNVWEMMKKNSNVSKRQLYHASKDELWESVHEKQRGLEERFLPAPIRLCVVA